MAENEQHYFANDGSNWTTPPSPVSTKEAREADKALDEQAKEGDGPTAPNDTELHRTIVEGSESVNLAKDSDEDADAPADEPSEDEDSTDDE